MDYSPCSLPTCSSAHLHLPLFPYIHWSIGLPSFSTLLCCLCSNKRLAITPPQLGPNFIIPCGLCPYKKTWPPTWRYPWRIGATALLFPHCYLYCNSESPLTLCTLPAILFSWTYRRTHARRFFSHPEPLYLQWHTISPVTVILPSKTCSCINIFCWSWINIIVQNYRPIPTPKLNPTHSLSLNS